MAGIFASRLAKRIDVGNKRWMLLCLMLGILLFLGGCGKEETPVEILTLHAFCPNYDRRDIVLYIDLQNQSGQKEIDGVNLEIACNTDDEQTFQCWLLEPEGILPDMHNQKTLMTLQHSELPEDEIYSLAVSLRQVNFTDGSVWKNENSSPDLTVEVDGEKGTGTFPVRLNEALFFEGSAHPSWVDPIYFQVDWTNILQEGDILAATYRIKAKTSDGSVISNGEEDGFYIYEYYADNSEWVASGMHNDVVTHSIDDHVFVEKCREKGAVVYEITISRVIDAEGIVWENQDSDGGIVSVLCEKKGYAFQEESTNESVTELISRIAKRAKQYGIEMEKPLVFISEHSHCVLRYENIDIRVELSDTDTVLPEKVAFVYYSKLQYNDMESYVQSVLDQISALRLCICPAVLCQQPYEELMERLESYNEDPDTYLGYDDPSNGVFGQVVNVLNADGETMNCMVIGVGKGLCDLPESLFWVRGVNLWEETP